MPSPHSIYLDHAATTPLDPRVLEAMLPCFTATFGNASSVHSYGRKAKAALEDARAVIARSLGASPGELFFTGSGTEADNLAIRGTWLGARRSGHTKILSAAAEHHAVLDTVNGLAEEGASVAIMPVTGTGQVDAACVEKTMTPDTGLVSIMHANNEVGTINPITEIGGVVHTLGALLHTDAVQTFGRIPVNVNTLGVDLLTISAHKIHGPKGIAALYIRKGVECAPIMRGGGQERGTRPGTENVALAVGFAKAAELAIDTMTAEAERVNHLSSALAAALRETFPELIINGHAASRLPHILNISFDSRKLSMEGEMLVPNLDLEGIAVSAGSACTSGSIQPSHVLLAMGRDAETARASVRFSFGRSNSREDVVAVVERLGRIIERMRKK